VDVLLEESENGRTVYYPDPGYVRYREVRALARDNDRDGLVEIVATLKRDIESWRKEYGVETHEELRASTAETAVTESEVYERQEIAEDWE
jgi:hypothetical protein